MGQQAANVIDFTAYRARRVQNSPVPAAIPSDLAQGRMLYAVPVLMPFMIAWLPVWSIAAFSSGASDE